MNKKIDFIRGATNGSFNYYRIKNNHSSSLSTKNIIKPTLLRENLKNLISMSSQKKVVLNSIDIIDGLIYNEDKLSIKDKTDINRLIICATNYEKNKHFFCKNRICPICNNIKQNNRNKNLNKKIERLIAPTFLTLTTPSLFLNEDLNKELINMKDVFKNVNSSIRKNRKLYISGLRKLEISINIKNKTFHPHFHLLIENSNNETNEIINYWEKYFPNIDKQAQNTVSPFNLKGLINYINKPFITFSKKGKTDSPEIISIMLLKLYHNTYRVRMFQNYGDFINKRPKVNNKCSI